MKLAATILATLAGVNEATIACATGTQLFEVTCDATNGFDIKINEACRQSHFSFVDFANSFVWGDATVVKMADPALSPPTADAVVAGSSTATPPVTCDPKLKATGSVKDSSTTANAFNLQVPFDTCKITSSMKADANHANQQYIEYVLYWNSQTMDTTLATQALYQIGQVKMVCRVDPYQEDAVNVIVSEDTAIADPAEQRVDIAAGLELEVGKLDFTDANKFDFTGATALAVTNTAGGTLGQTMPGTGYTALTAGGAVKLGDYMQLQLKEVAASGILAKYAVSLEKCWASVAALPALNTPSPANWFADSQTNPAAADEFIFWDNFCSLYPDWVGPNKDPLATGYLKETTNHQHSIHAVHLRQFGFLSQQANYATPATGNEIYYHCFVKVCPIADEATCSTLQLDGTTATACTATTFAAPSRRRRDAEPDGTLGMNAPKLVSERVPNANCAEVDRTGAVCVKGKSNSSSSSSATATCAATSLMAMLTGALLR